MPAILDSPESMLYRISMDNGHSFDALSSALMNINLESARVSAFHATGDWSIEYPRYECLKLHLLLRGRMSVGIPGRTERYHLKAGDCILMTGGQPFVNASDLAVMPRLSISDVIKTNDGDVMTINGGGETVWIGTKFEFESGLPSVLFARLPPAIHIAEDLQESADLRSHLEQFRGEYLGHAPGRALLMNSLARIIMVQILREYLMSARADKNWLVALSDERLSRVLEAIQHDYSEGWTLKKLAGVARMSRSRFAALFKDQLGLTPMEYLSLWRMHVARERLAASDENMSDLSKAVGYESESAFSDAFKKVMKVRPGFYRRSVRSGPVDRLQP